MQYETVVRTCTYNKNICNIYMVFIYVFTLYKGSNVAIDNI